MWSGIDKVVLAEHWEEDKNVLRNLGKMDLVLALSTLRKVRRSIFRERIALLTLFIVVQVQLKESEDLKVHYERELRMKQDAIEGLKRDVQQKSNELVKTKEDLESALNKTIEEYEGRLKALKLEFEAKLNEVPKLHQVSTKAVHI